jgi:FAD/FMN-containing dehydrogenase
VKWRGSSRFLTASPDEHADLFWGVRGGGGNFGIVTSFEYQLHPVGPVLGGMTLYDLSQAKEVLRFFREFSAGCPDELSTEAAFLTGPDGTRMVAIVVCYCGAVAEGEKVLQPLRTFGAPIADLIRPLPYVEMQSLFDESMPPGRLHYWKANFLRTVSDDAIELLVEAATTMPSPTALVILQQMHGAASRVSATATAFAQRHEQYNFEIISNWTDPVESEKNVKWARASWAAMQPFVEQNVYVNNLLEEEGEEGVRAAYGPNYKRLAELKNTYDPTNFFRVNHNITPTVKSLPGGGSDRSQSPRLGGGA